MSLSIQGKTAIVTGASGGIGAAIALQLAQQGLKVIGTATSDDGAAKISAALSAHAGCRGAKLDVNDAAAGEALVEVLAGLQPGDQVALDPVKAGMLVIRTRTLPNLLWDSVDLVWRVPGEIGR